MPCGTGSCWQCHMQALSRTSDRKYTTDYPAGTGGGMGQARQGDDANLGCCAAHLGAHKDSSYQGPRIPGFQDSRIPGSHGREASFDWNIRTPAFRYGKLSVLSMYFALVRNKCCLHHFHPRAAHCALRSAICDCGPTWLRQCFVRLDACPAAKMWVCRWRP